MKTTETPTFAWVTKPAAKFTCRLCKEEFPSRNKLHSHLEITKHYSSPPPSSTAEVASPLAPVIVDSKADSSKVGSGTAFRDYHYMEIRYLLHPKSTPDWGCMETGSGMSMIDSTLLTGLRYWVKRVTSKEPIKIHGLGDTIYNSWETVVMPIYLPDESGTKLAKITREFHVVDDLECRLLIANDIIVPEQIDISITKRKIRVGSCKDIICTLRSTPRDRISKHPVRAASTMTIPAKGTEYVPIRFAGLKADQDYLFNPYPYHMYMPDDTYVLSTGVSAQEEGIWVTNVGEKDVIVVKGCRIGYISRNGATTNCWPEISNGERKSEQMSTKTSVSTTMTSKPSPTPTPTLTPQTIKISQAFEYDAQAEPINQPLQDARVIETAEATMAVQKERAKPAEPPSEHVTAFVLPPVDVPDRMYLKELANPSESVASPPSEHVTAFVLPPFYVPRMYLKELASSSEAPPPLIDITPENEEFQDEISRDEQGDLDEDPPDKVDVFQQLLQGQQRTNQAIADAIAKLAIVLGNNNAANNGPLLADDAYEEFKSSDCPDDSPFVFQDYSRSVNKYMGSPPVDIQDHLNHEVELAFSPPSPPIDVPGRKYHEELANPSERGVLPPAFSPPVDIQDYLNHEVSAVDLESVSLFSPPSPSTLLSCATPYRLQSIRSKSPVAFLFSSAYNTIPSSSLSTLFGMPLLIDHQYSSDLINNPQLPNPFPPSSHRHSPFFSPFSATPSKLLEQFWRDCAVLLSTHTLVALLLFLHVRLALHTLLALPISAFQLSSLSYPQPRIHKLAERAHSCTWRF
jgi:hypothetical protein